MSTLSLLYARRMLTRSRCCRKGRRRQRRQDAEKDSLLGVVGLGGAAEQDDDDDSDVEVYGRLEIKAAAEAEVMRQTKQSNRRRARKNRK